MKRERTPEELRQYKKRLRDRLLLALLLALVVMITTFEVYWLRRGGLPVSGGMLAYSLLNLNTLFLLVLTFLIFRNLTKLFLERRRRVFGSRLRSRLVATFIALALLPTLFLFFMSWQLISSRVEYRLNYRVEESLKWALERGQAYVQGMENKVWITGHLIQEELQNKNPMAAGGEALKAVLDGHRAELQLTALTVLNPAGEPLGESVEPQSINPGALKPLPLEANPAPGKSLYRQRVPQGEVISLPLPLRSASGVPVGYVILRQLIPKAHLTQMVEVGNSLKDLRELQSVLRPVKVSHYLILVIVTLLAVMSAIWLAFYMAREITTPIRQLAEGTLKVAGGDYDFHIVQQGRDEIGFLVQSFNKMTQDLQQSQAQLAAAYAQLSHSHGELGAQKRHMEILLKKVAAGVIGVDAQNRINLINDSAAQMLRVRREEVLGKDARALFPPEAIQRLGEVVAEARRSRRGTVEKPLHLNLPDRTLYLLVKPTVLKDESGQDLGIVVVFEDLTELEQAQRLAAWREVARRIAHEVKNPLTPIKLAAQRLERRFKGRFGKDAPGPGEDAQVFEECTQIIISQVDELKNLVNEFSRFARLPHLTLAPHDLNSLIQNALLLYQENETRVNFEFHPDPGLPPLLLDREQIKRLLLNLLDNALAAIPDSGVITVAIKGDPAQDRVVLVVADTGKGIPGRDKARIFEPYFSTKRGGTGLGLAIVNSIVTEHQGHIRVEDNHPRGTRFTIELPMRR